METIFTDDRLPDVQIRWHGGAIFNIWLSGEIPHYHTEHGWTNTDCFTNYGQAGCGSNGPDANEAVKIAKEHFNEIWADVYRGADYGED